MKAEIIIRACTIEEEFSNLKFVLSRKDFYVANGYSVAYPDSSVLQDYKILENPNLMWETFKDSEYDEKYYQEGLNVLYPLKEQLEQLVGKILGLDKNWPFKAFPSYQIILTRYGPGGSYHYDKGTIVMLTTREGRFKRADPVQTIVHEIVHIGIEESIVQKYKLIHWEKERLVDLLVSTVYKDEIPKYRMQDTGIVGIENYVNSDTILNLPLSIEKYISEKRRA
jgi:hypothetical protein